MSTPKSGNALDALLGRMKAAASPLREALLEIHGQYAPVMDGVVASYIPELALADPNWFGLSVVTVDGQSVDVGDHQQTFTIQSVSKPLIFGLALEDQGREAVLAKVGVEPTGEAFNSIELDEVSNRPYNPMVNAGAIATADLVAGKDLPDRVKRMLAMFGRYVGHPVHVDNGVYMSERSTGHRNRAIGHLMLNFGMISDRVDDTLDLYFQQCSVLVTAHDLAMVGATLANGGVNPVTGERALRQEFVRDLLSVMYTCGMYDSAGQWVYEVGLPAKSGVGGGIVAVVPGKLGIGLFSPPLDSKGNSVRGVGACVELARRFGLHLFESGFTGPDIVGELNPRRARGSG
ncbi:MAG: glutaminase A [Deltaproteobacteria bacterium]|nr:glutaminase A [Deltaproteobacteria bacterium]